ncbi:DUF4097 family beta strand repeat protein [Candidatus Dependentiae bacterium]|nr:DUF4097 family beta strand repeat protein [Candidatus Dependentiae bacterium]
MKRIFSMVILSIYCVAISLKGTSSLDNLTDLFKNVSITTSSLTDTESSLTEKEVISKEIPFESAGTITIVNKTGSVKVTGWDKDSLAYEITKFAANRENLKKIDIVMGLDPKKANFETKYDERSIKAKVSYVVKVPRKAVLEKISAGSGDITIEDVKAAISAKTGSGEVTLTNVKGPIDAVTGSGSLAIRVDEGSSDSLSLQTGSGSITIKHAGGSVDARTGSGSIELDQRSVPTDTALSLRTGSGNIKLTLPQDSNATVEGSMGSGKFKSDFKELTQSKKTIVGELGTGGASIELKTGSGSITIKGSGIKEDTKVPQSIKNK